MFKIPPTAISILDKVPAALNFCVYTIIYNGIFFQVHTPGFTQPLKSGYQRNLVEGHGKLQV